MPTAAADPEGRDHTAIVQTAIKDVETTQAADIDRVLKAAQEASADEVSEVLDDAICEMKGYFGSLEANSVSDAEAEGALSTVESWITDNVSNGSLEERIAGALTMVNADQLVESLNKVPA
jgi:hypothetical protein